jgi:serine/threonine protein kinase
MDLAEAVRHLHSRRILHRDLKPGNIGFDHDGVLKVFDFDISRILPEFHDADANATFKLTRKIGTPRYISPECARGEPYNCKADVYTFGLLCYELLTIKLPYIEIPKAKHEEIVFHQGIRPVTPKSWPIEIRSFLKRCWSDDIKERPTMEEAQRELQKYLPILMKVHGKPSWPWVNKSRSKLARKNHHQSFFSLLSSGVERSRGRCSSLLN